jgi:hypothetical protein
VVTPVDQPSQRASIISTTIRAALRAVLWSWMPPPVCAVLTRILGPAGHWITATRLRRRLIGGVAIWHAIGLLAVAVASPARADSSESLPSNSTFNWMDVRDSHGILVWDYFMSIDEGSAAHPMYTVFSFFIQLEYELYRGVTGFAIWFVTYALRFEWLSILVAPFRAIGDATQTITDQFQLSGLLLTATAALAGWWILRGRWSTGIYELLMSAAIAAAAVGILANPVDRVAGQDGLIMQARDAGVQLAAGLANKGDTSSSSDKLIDQISAQMADTFIRQPTQLLNFGRVIDGSPDGERCTQAWDAGHEKADGNTKDTLKDNIDGCGGDGAKQMKDFADHPGPGQVGSGIAMLLAGTILLGFAALLAFTLILAALSAIGSAVKGIVVTVVGILPGAGRGALWKTIANVVMSMAIMVFAVVFLVGYMMVISELFKGDTDSPLMMKFVLTDVALIAGLVLFRRAVKGLRKFSDTLARKLGSRPGAAPTAISTKTPVSPLAQAAYAGQVARQAYQSGKGLAKTAGRAGVGTAKAGKALANGTAAASSAATLGTAAVVYGAGRIATAGVKKVTGRGAGSRTKEAAVASESTSTEAVPRIRKTANIDLPPTRSAVTVGESNAGVAAVPAPRRARTENASNTPGIKRPVATAPSISPSRGKDVLRVGRTTISGPGGERFREYSTGEGPSLLLPARGPRPSSPPRRPRPTVSPAATSHPTEVLHRVAAASRR